MSLIPQSIQTFTSSKWETTARLASAASLTADFTWENRAQVANIAVSALQSSVEALKDNYVRPSEIPVHAAVNTIHRVFSDSIRIKQITTLVASKINITQVLPEEILGRKKKDIHFQSIFSSITSVHREEIASSDSLKTKVAGATRLLLSPIAALGKYVFNRTYNHYLEKFVPKHIKTLQEKIISVEFMKNLMASIIDNLDILDRFKFSQNEQARLQAELIEKINVVISLLDPDASKLDKCVYNLVVNKLQHIIHNILNEIACNILNLAAKNNNDILIAFFKHFDINISNPNYIDEESLSKFCTFLSIVMLNAFRDAFDSKSIDEQQFAVKIAELPANLPPSLINAINNSVIKDVDKVFKKVEILPFILREPLELLTLNGARQWLQRNKASDIFIRQKDLISRYTIELFTKINAHYIDPQLRQSDKEYFNSQEAKIKEIYQKIFGIDKSHSKVKIEALD